MQSRLENNSSDYRFSAGATILFTTARMMDYVGLTNLSFYLDLGLLTLLGTRAARDLTAYGPAKAFEETKQLAQNPVALFNSYRAAKKPVVNREIEDANFTASPVLKK